MPTLVHLAPERLRLRITRSGLRGRPTVVEVAKGEQSVCEGVFAMPVLPDFSQTHQWARELRTWGRDRLVAVYFRISSDEPLYVGRFGAQKTFGPASQVLKTIRENPWGAEVLVPRRVPVKAIRDVRRIRQDVGWVETPETKHKYECLCSSCIPGGRPDLLRRCRAAFNTGVERLHSAGANEASVLDALGRMEIALERAGHRLSPKRLLSLAAHESPRVRRRLAWSLGSFGPEETTPTFERLLNDDDDAVREAAIENALRSLGPRRARESVAANAPGLLREFVEALQYFQDSATAEVLEALASHEDPKVAEAATLALQDEESG